MEEYSRIVITGGEYQSFRDDVLKRIRSAQYEAMRAVNKEMISLYWEIGRQITERQKTLGWGKSVVENLSHDIQAEFPGIQGFSVRNIRNMARFYNEYQSNEILQPLVAEISWATFVHYGEVQRHARATFLHSRNQAIWLDKECADTSDRGQGL